MLSAWICMASNRYNPNAPDALVMHEQVGFK